MEKFYKINKNILLILYVNFFSNFLLVNCILNDNFLIDLDQMSKLNIFEIFFEKNKRNLYNSMKRK